MLTISIDVDGTIVSSKYPNIGTLQHGAKEVINKWYEKHCVVINTCRSEEHEQAALWFLKDNGINFHYFNENPTHLIEQYGTDTRKLSADIYFDDKAAGGFMGWEKAEQYVEWMENRKPVIICIVGESATGKTQLANYIESRFAVNMIESYTDRPKRKPTETGHTFISAAEFDLLKQEDMIAWTKFGDYRYCCLKSDVQMENSYVLDEKGLLLLLANFRNEYDIYSIRVKCDDDVRLLRSGDQARIDRDRGVFSLPDRFFNFVLNTTELELDDYPQELIQTIASWLNRGWKY